MKKIFTVVTILMIAVLLAGCAVAPSVPSYTTRKPWQIIENSTVNRERIDFTAKRFSYNGSTPTLIAEGWLGFTIRESAASTELSTGLHLTHNESSVYNGKTDTITSVVTFNRSDLLPINSLKELRLTADETEKGYVAEVDYEEMKTDITPLGGQKTEYKLKSGSYYDNEQLYHLARAIPELKPKSSHTFRIATPYDMYANNKFFTHKIRVDVATEVVPLEVPKSVFDMAIARTGGESGKLNDDGVYKIDCIALKISLDTDKSGPPIFMYLSDLKFIDNEALRADPANHNYSYTTNVPIKIIVSEYAITNALTFTNEYNISDYSTLS